jgi:hypothetical protein
MNKPVLACCAAALLLAACAGAPPVAPEQPGGRPAMPPSLGLFSPVRVPDGHEPALLLVARGVQIFRCERLGDAFDWRFRQPEAELFDPQGQPAGRHGANFSFEHRDGSRLLGSVTGHEKSPEADALPWLLLSTRSFGKGAFGGVSFVQRVHTRGGMPPSGCSAGQANRLLRVDFSADFVFYRRRG